MEKKYMENERRSFDAYKQTKVDPEATKKAINGKTESNNTDFAKDTDMYSYKRDSSGNAFVILRFLPSINTLPPTFIRHRHFFEGNGWYTDYCPTTLGKECPICKEFNDPMWKKAEKSDEETQKRLKGIVGKRSRNKQYFSNIYIVKDSNQPELNGKVLKWQYGPKVYARIKTALEPSKQMVEAGIKPIDVFHMYNGANFILKIKTVDKRANYDDCQWMQAGPLFDNDDQMKAVYDQIFDLTKYTPEVVNTKSYEELQAQAYKVLGVPGNVGGQPAAPTMTGQTTVQPTVTSTVESTTTQSVVESTVETEPTPNTNTVESAGSSVEPAASDDIDAYFDDM
jgi:hypothetical protein